MKLPLYERIGDFVLGIFHVIKTKWDKIIPIIISIVSVAISLNTWNSYRTANEEYMQRSNQALVNSSKLAETDIDILTGKVAESDHIAVTKNQIDYQIYSLKQNLQVIEDIQITRLPQRNSMNYQVYRKDLADVIYRLNAKVTELFENKKYKQYFYLTAGDREDFMNSLAVVRRVLLDDRNALQKRNDLATKYLKFNQKFQEKNGKDLNERVSGDLNVYGGK
ncbi:hypothetical protein [Lacticaseibacillus paracasei]|uniref:hypothetical protein n=1 Tax=Lacticaseibacillus paracasei TaxID=1597 RepID=UPI0025A0B444|nr:hypothetical protein [Lacticaseibacillus paracasei]MDM7528856.1 hypothetical protein [Lacticaseibacillus paracasei]MDM7540917.1 hypothetical protein [Lacticaseibacillus paracasei]